MKAIPFLLAFVLLACLFDNDDEGRKVIGYSGGELCTGCGKATDGVYGRWLLRKDSTGSDSLYIYIATSETNLRPNFNRSQLFNKLSSSHPKSRVYDDGGQCLNVDQSPDDSIPVEPCIHFLYDKDLN